MLKQNVLCTVHSKVNPFIQVLLLFNFSTSKHQLLIIFLVLTKYFGLLILSNNYIIDITKANPTQTILITLLRKTTILYYLKSYPPPVYFLLCIITHIITLILLGYCCKYFIYIKKRKSNISLDFIPKLLFYLLLLFGQHALELYSIILLIVFKKSIQLPTSPVYSHFHNYPLLSDSIEYTLDAIVIGVLNLIFYIITNISLFFGCYLINNPFHCIKAPLSFRHSQYCIFLVIIMNLYSIHHWEVFLTGTALIVFKNINLVLILSIIFFQIGLNLYKYEHKNFAYYFMEFISLFCLVSIIIEIMIYIMEYIFSIGETIMLLFLKLVLTVILINYENYIQARYLSYIAKTYLFEPFDHSHLNQIIESYYFILDHLISLKHNNKAHVLTDIISTHKKTCQNEYCKCKLVKPYPEMSTDNEEFKQYLLYNIGFLIETTFIHISSYSNIEIAIFLSDYYYHIKENILMSFAIIQSAFTLRRSKINVVYILNLYYINQTFIEEYIKRFRLCPDAVKFRKIFEDISTNFDFYKQIVKYSNTFDSLIDAKINFENSIKFEKDQDTGEDKSISSSLQSKDILRNILEGLAKVNKLSKEIKGKLKHPNSQKRGLEFYYISYLFYSFFDRKIPSELIRQFSELTIGESFVGLTYKETQMKFEKLLDKYLSRTSSINHVIIKCSKGLLIKYFSSNLCNLLGFNQASLLGEPFHSIFPMNLRESHSMAIYHTLINKRSFFFKKRTIIFDANEHYLPCEVSAGAMPHLSKQLLIICEVQIHKQRSNDLSFILDDKFNGISINENAEKKYCITLNLLKKTDTELIEVFDISPKYIKDNFSKDLEIINTFQSQMKLCTIELYSKLLYRFNENNNDNNNIGERDEKKFKLSNVSLEINNKMKNERPRICKRSIKYIKIKNVIMQNINKTLNKLSDSPVKEEKLKQLTNTIIGLKRTLTEINKSISRYNNSNNNYNNNKDSKPASIVINFKVELKTLYDMPLYIFRLKDMIDNNNIKIQAESDAGLTSLFLPATKAIDIKKKDYSEFDNMLRKGISLKKIKAKTTETMFSKTKPELTVIVISVLISFFLSLYILISEIDNIKKIIKSMEFLYISRVHQESLLNYESSLFSIFFDFGGLTQMNITDDELYASFDFLTFSLINSLVVFYQKLDSYNEKLNENFYSYLQNNSYTKIFINWIPETYQSDFINEIHYIVYQSRMVLKEKNKENIQKDIELLFFNKYLTNPTMPINSPFGAVLYFVSLNVPLSLSGSIQSVSNEVTQKMILLLINKKKLILSFEIICYISNLFFYFFVILFLKKYNRQVVKLIISMFIDNSNRIEKNGFRNRSENGYMKQKIKLLIQLIKNFNEVNSNAMKTFLKENNNSILNTRINANGHNSIGMIDGNINNHNQHSKQMILFNDTNISTNNNANFSSTQTLNVTNSVNISQTNQTTSQNLILKPNEVSNNHLFKQLAASNKNTKSDTNNNIEHDDIPTLLFIKLLQKKTVCIINKYLFVIYICLVVNLVVTVLRFCNTLDYQNFSIIALKMFNTFTNFFMAVPTFFNSFRNKVINHNGTLHLYDNINLSFDNYLQEIINITSSTSINRLPNSVLFWKELHLKMKDPSVNKQALCFNDTVCIDMLSDPKSMFSEGIFLGYQLLVQKALESFNDYRRLVDDKPDFTIEDLKKRVLSFDFVLIQKFAEFVLHRIQSSYYDVFNADYRVFSTGVEVKTIYLNTIIFAIEILGIIVILFCIITRISKKLYQISFSCAKFNTAMFSNQNFKGH